MGGGQSRIRGDILFQPPHKPRDVFTAYQLTQHIKINNTSITLEKEHVTENQQVEILLIEDSNLDAEMTLRALKKNRIANQVVHISDGAAAIDFLFGTGIYTGRSPENKPKLIMLDLKMPKIDGIEVLKRIKSNETTKRIPVVVLTSSKENPDIEKCYDLGANSYIVKPVGFQNFTNAISTSGLYWMVINQPLP